MRRENHHPDATPVEALFFFASEMHQNPHRTPLGHTGPHWLARIGKKGQKAPMCAMAREKATGDKLSSQILSLINGCQG